MTDDDFKRIWAEHGNPSCGPWWDDRMPAFRAIARAAVAEEREACAKVCEACEPAAWTSIWEAATRACAEDIRSRSAAGEQKETHK